MNAKIIILDNQTIFSDPLARENIFSSLRYAGFLHIDDKPANFCTDDVVVFDIGSPVSSERIELLRELGAESGRVFILFGRILQQYKECITGVNCVIGWGHPTLLNPANNDINNSAHFRYCPNFADANKWLLANGKKEICWRTACGLQHSKEIGVVSWSNIEHATDHTPNPRGKLYIFTDGAASRNGYSDCRASFAFYITDGQWSTRCAKRTLPIDIDGKIYRESNNRGEILALVHAFACIDRIIWPTPFTTIEIFSDSKLAVDAINKGYDLWVLKNALHDHMNISILSHAVDQFKTICKRWNCTLRHISAHKKTADDVVNSELWFVWNGNRIVDKLAQTVLCK